ncbi:MAG: hypothetical protein QOD46_368 [Actinomycetota bacterium]|nr:hypothetical protein [Actinomycetota bacterium]
MNDSGAPIDRDQTPTDTPLPDAPGEALRLIADSAELSVPLRLIGGTAVWFYCESARVPPLARPYGDIDFISVSKNNRSLTAFFEAHGYEADKLFNALHGAQRLNFTDSVRGRAVDVLLDRFVMCHTIELKDRLALGGPAIPVTDLLLTKAQVIQLNEKDIKDIMALLLDHGASGTDGIDLARLAEATRSDWGLEHTVRKTLAEVEAGLDSMGLAADQAAVIKSNIAAVIAALDAAPKSSRWRMRARVGERIRWYDEPEEARR